MSVIYKYALHEFQEEVPMPDGAQVLTAQMQDGRITLWANTTPGKPRKSRSFRVFGTGHNIPPGHSYIATVQDGAYVWHVFEKAQP